MLEEQGATRSGLQERLQRIETQIHAACERSGRQRDSVTLIAVTKTFPVETVRSAVDAGLVHFGENKVQELVTKAAAIPGAVAGGRVVWHAIGHLQRNKAREVVACTDLFHALDSIRLAEELETRCTAADRILPCLVQVNVSGEPSKYGVDPDALVPLLKQLTPFERLRIEGLMTLAAPVDDPEEVRPQFNLLRHLSEEGSEHTPFELTKLSMGMSDDFVVAIEEGATHVRIGSALFGTRSTGLITGSVSVH